MGNKSVSIYPYKVGAILPAGHPLGLKKRSTTYYTYHKSIVDAKNCVDNWALIGRTSFIYDRKLKKRLVS